MAEFELGKRWPRNEESRGRMSFFEFCFDFDLVGFLGGRRGAGVHGVNGDGGD